MSKNRPSLPVSRREFLKTAAAASAAGLLGGCSTASTPTPIPTPAVSPTPAHSPEPTSTPAPVLRKPEMLKMYPHAVSKVIHTHHSAVRQEGSWNKDALREMLDASMVALTGAATARDAWAGLFEPGETIAIKVNAFINSMIFTTVPLVTAVTNSLEDAGIAPEQIVIYDFSSAELSRAGYTTNSNKPGVRCYGSDFRYPTRFQVNSIDTGLSPILLDSHALINIPVLKSHMITGMTFAMKNHYGSIDNPETMHTRIAQTLPALNALPEIRERTRLVIGDILQACLQHANSYPYWKSDYNGDSILVSHDPVAVDTAGLQILSQLKTEIGGDPEWNIKTATPILANATAAGVGASQPDQMEIIELRL